MIDLDDIFRYDDPPAAAMPRTPVAALPATMPVIMPGMVTEPVAKAEPGPDYQSDRSRLFATDPDRFFAGWKRDGRTWRAPGDDRGQQVQWDRGPRVWNRVFYFLKRPFAD